MAAMEEGDPGEAGTPTVVGEAVDLRLMARAAIVTGVVAMQQAAMGEPTLVVITADMEVTPMVGRVVITVDVDITVDMDITADIDTMVDGVAITAAGMGEAVGVSA
jgi:hypothetical protein